MAENITLSTVGSLQNTTTAATTINNNFSAITTALQNVLSLSGELPNQMQSSLDMNSNRIINLPAPQGTNDPVRLTDLAAATPGGTLNFYTSNYNVLGNVQGGRLTPTAGSPILTTDAIASSTLYYSPYVGNNLLVKGNLVQFTSGPTDNTGWSLNIGSLATGQYNVYASNTGLYTGAYSTAPVRYNGILTDPANNNTYLGSINLSTAGQITCHVSYESQRRFDVWNNYNQIPLTLKNLTVERNYTYNPRNQYTAPQAFNNNTNNAAYIMVGQPTNVNSAFYGRIYFNSTGGSYGIITGIGWNTTTAYSGTLGGGGHDDLVTLGGLTLPATYINPSATGFNTIYMIVGAAVNSSNTNTIINSSSTANAYEDQANATYMSVSWLG